MTEWEDRGAGDLRACRGGLIARAQAPLEGQGGWWWAVYDAGTGDVLAHPGRRFETEAEVRLYLEGWMDGHARVLG